MKNVEEQDNRGIKKDGIKRETWMKLRNDVKR